MQRFSKERPLDLAWRNYKIAFENAPKMHRVLEAQITSDLLDWALFF